MFSLFCPKSRCERTYYLRQLAFCHTEFISVSRHDSCTLFVAILSENLKQVQIDCGGKGFRLTVRVNVFVIFVRNLVAKGLIVCANSTLFLAFCHTEFISVSRHDSCTLFIAIPSEDLKRVQIDGRCKCFHLTMG